MIDWRWIEIDALKSQEKWNEAKEYLIKSWRQDPQEVKGAIRLGFFCWYALVNEENLGIKDIDFVELETMLKEVTQFGLTHFMEYEDFLWCFGYMISLFPYYFGDYEIWEEKSISMLKNAYELSPEDPVYRYSYLASFPNTVTQLKGEFHQLQAVLEDRFQGEGLLSQYFKDVWHGWHPN